MIGREPIFPPRASAATICWRGDGLHRYRSLGAFERVSSSSPGRPYTTRTPTSARFTARRCSARSGLLRRSWPVPGTCRSQATHSSASRFSCERPRLGIRGYVSADAGRGDPMNNATTRTDLVGKLRKGEDAELGVGS
jgi:hypothetical protein